jgi:5-formyltetrahydrofolate cyclo-ligase
MEKEEARSRIARALDVLTMEDRMERSRKIAHLLYSIPEYERAGTVMLFVSMADEVDTMPVIARSLHHRKRVACPRCIAGCRDMEAVLIHDPTKDLARGSFGIWEPIGKEVVPPGEIDFVVVPARGFDEHGNRLGRGAGGPLRSTRPASWPLPPSGPEARGR